jgi:hypothetical protein
MTQEPVAWIHNFIEGGISIGKRPADLDRHPDRWTALYKEPKPCPTCEALARTVMLDQTSHDTTPPQRTEQEPPKYSFKAHWEKDGRIGVVAVVERPDGGFHVLEDIIDAPKEKNA